jgi:hypothetical protein
MTEVTPRSSKYVLSKLLLSLCYQTDVHPTSSALHMYNLHMGWASCEISLFNATPRVYLLIILILLSQSSIPSTKVLQESRDLKLFIIFRLLHEENYAYDIILCLSVIVCVCVCVYDVNATLMKFTEILWS